MMPAMRQATTAETLISVDAGQKTTYVSYTYTDYIQNMDKELRIHSTTMYII